MATVELTLSEADLEAIATRVADKLAEKLKPSTNGTGVKERWSESEAAGVVGTSKYSLARWRKAGCFAVASPTRPVAYSRADLDGVLEFLRTRENGNN